jgi:3-oxoacyl-[acyl-carrier protein] reductase
MIDTQMTRSAVFVVSGAGGALGRAIVDALAARSVVVLALDRTPAPGGIGEGVRWIKLDLTSEAEIGAALDTLDEGERIAGVINAVGMISNQPLIDRRLRPMTKESWQRVLDANLTAPFLLAAASAARMVRTGGGAIVNFSSITAKGNAGQAAYSAAKAGLESLTRTMAAELGPLGIRVNALAPGFIDVSSTRAALSEPFLADYGKRTPLRRLGSTAEVVDAVDFLLTNTFVNGEILALDGGLRL